ncbi:MAG: DUF2891 family protein, partial [Lentimicrobiaceae bacterium]|nr:DUF2891 family protein [Lentimicrobiaceae bacterium]
MKTTLTLFLLLAQLFAFSQSQLTGAQASHFAKLALKCIFQEYPNKPGEVLGSDMDIKPVREYRPAFYGCFDWHSSVHGHWMLVKLLKEFPGIPEAEQIRAALNTNLTPGNILVEVK